MADTAERNRPVARMQTVLLLETPAAQPAQLLSRFSCNCGLCACGVCVQKLEA